MGFDAGNFFNNIFNNISKISDNNSYIIKKDDNQSSYGENTVYLPDEAPDENVLHVKDMVMYGIPNPDIQPDERSILKYAMPDLPEEAPIAKYAVPSPEIRPEEGPVEKYAMPDLPGEAPVAMYAVPSPEIRPEEGPVAMYAVPDPTFTEVKYGIPAFTKTEPEPVPVPTQSVAPQPAKNPWKFNLSGLFRSVFSGESSSFAQRLNNFFTSIFSRWS